MNRFFKIRVIFGALFLVVMGFVGGVYYSSGAPIDTDISAEPRVVIASAVAAEGVVPEAEPEEYIVHYFRDIVDLREPEAIQPESVSKFKVAIIIDDMGPDRKRGFGVIDIDAPLTLAFLPYADRLPQMTKEAAARGHELMIHMPMEPMNPALDIGGIGLREDMDAGRWGEELVKAFSSFEGYVGMNNHMGSRLTQNEVAMDYVMEQLDERGMYFIDSKTISTSVAGEVARHAGLRVADRDVFLDHEDTLEFVRAALQKLEGTARRKGHAIAIGHPKDVTIAGLEEWIPTLAAKGIELVHASELVRVYEPEELDPRSDEIEEAVEGGVFDTYKEENEPVNLDVLPQSLAPPHE